MRKYIPELKNTKLFSEISGKDIEKMLSCLGGRVGRYEKGEYIFRIGERSESIAVLVKGSLHIQYDDYWGNRSILGNISVGEMFGEAYAISENIVMMNDVVAIEESEIVFFDFKRIISSCSNACPVHTKIIQNMFLAISEKNRKLVQKLSFMSKRTTREKLIAYLSDEARRHGNSFTIPFNRQQLADYLSVDRSAMSKELCKMRDEGLIKFDRSCFRLL